MYSVYDTKAEVYSNPMMFNTEKEALRSFATVANDKSTAIGQYPNDHILVRLGTFENVSGFMEFKPKELVKASSLVKSEIPEENEKLQKVN